MKKIRFRKKKLLNNITNYINYKDIIPYQNRILNHFMNNFLIQKVKSKKKTKSKRRND